MGRLIGLELENFKSYKGQAKVGLGDTSFTSIIGPNGAGKSNMMDAISFVLGVQSSHLRSHQLKDLIYRGRLDGSASASNQPTTASVCATYQKSNGELMKLKRVIKASGTSDYKINERNVTALQYTSALKAENILVKARNFLVFQGDIESIASQSPADLSKLVETISGSAELAAEYNQVKEDMERAREVATEVFTRKRNLNSESKQYKEQVRERELFEEKLTEKHKCVKTLHLYRIFHNQRRHFELLSDIERITQSIQEAESKHTSEQEAHASLVAEFSKLNLEQRKVESNRKDELLRAEVARRALLPLATNKKSLEARLSSTKSKLEDLARDKQNQTQLTETCKLELMQAETALREFEEQVKQAASKVNISPAGMEEYEELRRKFLSSSGSELEDEKAVILSDLSAIESSMQNLAAQKDSSLHRIADLESTIKRNFEPKMKDLEIDFQTLTLNKQEKIQKRASLKKTLEEVAFREKEVNFKLKETFNKLEEVSSQQQESKKQKKLGDNVKMLRNLLKDGAVKGVMYELVRSTQHRYDVALKTALGRNFDAIVVETTAVAHKCIEILKERRAGSATFIPLDSISVEQVNLNYLRSLGDETRPAIDIVKYDDQTLERAVQFVLGSTLIVDNIETGRDLKWNSSHKVSNKMVMLDGSIIQKSGFMTGGFSDSTSGTWSKHELKSLTRTKDELVEQLANLTLEKPRAVDIGNLDEEIAAIEEQLPETANKIKSIEREISEREQEIRFLQEQLASTEQAISEKFQEAQKFKEELRLADDKIAKLQSEIFADFCTKYGLESITDYEFLNGEATRSRARKRAELQRLISVKKNSLDFQSESVRDTEVRIENLERSSSVCEEELEKLNQNFSLQTAELSALEAKLEELSQQTAQNKSKLSNMLRDSKTSEDACKEFEGEVKTLNEELMSVEESRLKIDSERLNMLKNCKMEGVDLPLEDGFLDSISFDEEGQDVSHMAYMVHVDYGLLDLRMQTYSVRTEAELKVRIENVEQELESLTPNLRAMERLREVDQKLREFDRDFTRARQDEKRATARFNEVKESRTSLFMKAFTHISDKIDGIYKELTMSSTSPLGGSAYLTLEDEEEPYAAGIKYHAMPPMKRFRDMDLLSGGEKTMAALALLFAIHSFQPAPFFVLDEIDAALDNTNVSKIANYIKAHAGPEFQFIVISLKSSLFENSDALVGIYREQRENSSKTVSLDLRSYSDEPQEISIESAAASA